jgi:IclR family KDG regulon transcriptional repressor
MPSSSATASNVLDILLLFHESRRELTAGEIGKLISTPRSTTYRYIRTLCNKGFLDHTASGGYQPGPSLLQFAYLIYSGSDINQIALPVMEQIMGETRETVLLTRKFGRHSVCIERVEGPQAIRITVERGHMQPLHAGASSKILLAYAGRREWDHYVSQPLEEFTSNTITNPDALIDHLRAIRKQGYCISDGEVDEGALAVAVPILDECDRLAAGLSVTGPAFRLDNARVEHHLAALRAGAAAIEQQLA